LTDSGEKNMSARAALSLWRPLLLADVVSDIGNFMQNVGAGCNVSRGPTDCLYGLQTRSFFRDPFAARTASINSHLPGGLPHFEMQTGRYPEN
jgi:hypothetical protein